MKDQSYRSTRISSNSKSTRKLWKDLHVLVLKSDDESSPTCEDSKKASDFIDFFVDTIEQIKVTTVVHRWSRRFYYRNFPTNHDTAIGKFNCWCSTQIMFTGSCANIACKTLFVVAYAVSVQALQSFSLWELNTDIKESRHCHATAWEQGVADRKNYRTMSNLTVVAKLLERVVCNQRPTFWKQIMLFRLHRVHRGGSSRRRVPC